jgi:hypothetical protein
VFVEAARRAGFAPRVEPAGLLGFSKGDRPADFETTEGEVTAANDVCVMHPLRPQYLARTIKDPGSACAAYVAHEKGKYVEPCKAAGILFRPLCGDVFRVFDETSQRFIKTMAKADATRHGCRREEVTCAIRQALAVAVMRGNAKSILRRAPLSAHPVLDEPFSNVPSTFSSLPPLPPSHPSIPPVSGVDSAPALAVAAPQSSFFATSSSAALLPQSLALPPHVSHHPFSSVSATSAPNQQQEVNVDDDDDTTHTTTHLPSRPPLNSFLPSSQARQVLAAL